MLNCTLRIYVCKKERQRGGGRRLCDIGSVGVSTHESCGGDKEATQAPRLLLWETFFRLFFNLELMRFSAAILCSVVSVYPILSSQPDL